MGSSISWLAPSLFGLLADSQGARTAILLAAVLYGATALWLQTDRTLRSLDNDPAPLSRHP